MFYVMVNITAFYFLKAERNSMGTHFVYVVTFFQKQAEQTYGVCATTYLI